MRRAIPESEQIFIDDLALYVNSPIEEKVFKLLWGTRGKKGNHALHHVFLHDCETSHLEEILKIPGLNDEHAEVCREILAKRRVNPTWGINYTFDQIKESFV